MKNGLKELVFIIDRSGSMSGLEEDTIGGFNAMLQEQQDVGCETVVTTALFDASFSLFHDRVQVERAAPLTRSDYKVGHGTAMLDAIGLAMHKIRKAQQNTKEAYRPEKTLFVIITDGEENRSHIYTTKMIRERIERRCKEYNWEFQFFGANMDAVSVAGELGIDAAHVQNFRTDSQGIQTAYSAMSALSTVFRMFGTAGEKPPRALNNSTIREHWHRTAVFTDSWEDKEEKAVPANELLPGELSAVLFQVGCYTVRSAQRVYRVNQDYTEMPATLEELETYKNHRNVFDGWLGNLRLVHEISARHHDGPEREFILVDGAKNAHNCYWSEEIQSIYTAKKDASIPDENASLFVYKFWIGSSHSVDYWSKLDPTGRMWRLSLSPYNDRVGEERFCIVGQPPVRFLVPEIQAEGNTNSEE